MVSIPITELIEFFSTKELAEDFIKKYSDYDYGFNIEEHDIDSIYHIDNYVPYWVGMDSSGDSSCFIEHFHDIETSFKKSLNIKGELWASGDGREFIIFAKSKEHAVKIANERRIQMIADNTWDKE